MPDCILFPPPGGTHTRDRKEEEKWQWGGRFTKETDKLVYDFNASISFDRRFWEQDIRGSIAHVTMLAKQGILTGEEKEQIIKGLEGIRADVENGTRLRSQKNTKTSTALWRPT